MEHHGNNNGNGNGQVKRQSRISSPPLEVRESGIHGRGAFASRKIRKGERIIEYLDPESTRQNAVAAVGAVTPEQKARVLKIIGTN